MRDNSKINRSNMYRRIGGRPAFPVLLVLLVLFTVCEKMPEYCGRGHGLDPKFQFCFDEKTYNLCGGKDYNPLGPICGIVVDIFRDSVIFAGVTNNVVME